MIKSFSSFISESYSDKVTVYHGTTYMLFSKIILKDKKLSPRPGNQYVYVTVDPDVAKRYSKAWTAWGIKEAAPALKTDPVYKGIIFEMSVDRKDLRPDPYNPEGEPDQYRIDGSIPLRKIIDYEVIDFSELKNEVNLLRAYSYWIGIGRATDEVDEPVDIGHSKKDMDKLSKSLDDLGL